MCENCGFVKTSWGCECERLKSHQSEYWKYARSLSMAIEQDCGVSVEAENIIRHAIADIGRKRKVTVKLIWRYLRNCHNDNLSRRLLYADFKAT